MLSGKLIKRLVYRALPYAHTVKKPREASEGPRSFDISLGFDDLDKGTSFAAVCCTYDMAYRSEQTVSFHRANDNEQENDS